MIADDGEEGDARVVERPEDRQRPEDIGECGASVVEQVPGVDDGVHVVLDGVGGDLLESAEEVLATLRTMVLLVAQMRIAGV